RQPASSSPASSTPITPEPRSASSAAALAEAHRHVVRQPSDSETQNHPRQPRSWVAHNRGGLLEHVSELGIEPPRMAGGRGSAGGGAAHSRDGLWPKAQPAGARWVRHWRYRAPLRRLPASAMPRLTTRPTCWTPAAPLRVMTGGLMGRDLPPMLGVV